MTGRTPQIDQTLPNAKTAKKGKLLNFYRRTELFWVALVLASVIAQATKTSDSSADYLDLLRSIELAFTLAFDIEIVIRFIAYWPDWKTFLSMPTNSFDLFLVVTTSVIQIPVIANASVYRWLTVFQLLRWYRFVLVFPRMKPLLVCYTFVSSLVGRRD